MQERPQYKVTPEQGWSKMQTLLEQSMPVMRRSRRFIIFWWTAAIAVVAILSSLYLMNERAEANIPQQVTSPASAIASNEANLSHIDKPATASAKSLNEVKSTDIESSAPISQNKSKLDHRSKIANPVTKTKTNVIKPSNGKSSDNTDDKKSMALSDMELNQVNKVNEDAIAIQTFKNINKEDVIHPETSTSDMDFISSVHEAGTIRQKSATLEYLPFVDAFSYQFSEQDIEWIQPGEFSYVHRSHRFSPAIDIGAMTGSQSGLGINGSVGADYALNSKLSMTAHVGYSSYEPGALHSGHKDNSNYETILGDSGNYLGTYITAEKVNSAADYNAINPYVKAIRQWDVSAGLKYALTKRFFIGGGLSLGLGITAKSEYPIISDLSSATPQADINFKTTFNPYDIVRSNMVSWYGGVGYHISRHFSISMNWKQGLDHYLLNGQLNTFGTTEKRSDYIRGMNLGFSYNL